MRERKRERKEERMENGKEGWRNGKIGNGEEREGRKKVNVSVFVCVNTLMQLCIRRQSYTIDVHVRTSTTQYAPGKFFSEQKELVAV